MKVDIPTGKHVLAVSGGVDSMVLLDLLSKKPGMQLVIAHFNHGIRSDSVKDEQLVRQTAKRYNIPLEVGQGKLRPGSSEERARKARYAYLEAVKEKHGADYIVTAHHQDDLIETALLNILRGTRRRGLSSIRSQNIKRPLLDVPKHEITIYAQKNKLRWREDESNKDSKYQRNYLRNQILPNLSARKRQEILDNLDKVAELNIEIDKNIATLSHVLLNNKLNRQTFTMLPPQVADELLAFWLRKNNLGHFDSKTVKRLGTSIRTGLPGSRQPVYGSWQIRLSNHTASLVHL